MRNIVQALQQTLFLLAFLTFYTPSVKAQNWTLFMKNEGVNCRTFKVDKEQNIYIISNDNRVFKFDRDGKFRAAFSFNPFGKISVLDVTHPAQPIVYFPDVQAVVVLNEQLDAVKTHFLGKLGLLNGETVAMGEDGFLYVFEAKENHLVRMAFDGKNLRRMDAIKLLNINDLQVFQLQIKGDVFYFNVPAKGILTYDKTGTLLKIYGVQNINNFAFDSGRLVYSKDKMVYEFDLNLAQSRPLSMPKEIAGKQQMLIENGRLYAQRGLALDVYVDSEL